MLCFQDGGLVCLIFLRNMNDARRKLLFIATIEVEDKISRILCHENP